MDGINVLKGFSADHMTYDNLLSDDILINAPTEDLERQYYFIDILSSFFRAKFADDIKSGNALDRYGNAALSELNNKNASGLSSMICFGCQMNARDSERINGILSDIGFDECEDETNADIVIFNTCTIRENANDHLYGRLGRLKQIKKSRPDMIIGICGCMMQETDEVETIKTKYPYVDMIFGTHNLYMFPELLYELIRKRNGHIDRLSFGGTKLLVDSSSDHEKYEKLKRYNSPDKEFRKLENKPVISVWEDSGKIVELNRTKRKFAFKQGINIMFGCNNFCSYCIVPYVRGREKSRTPDEIYNEILKAADDGVKEIMLLGQNVNSYKGGIGFPKLLKNIDVLTKGTGIDRIRFMTSHPKDLSDELIDVMASGERICRQFHLPMQSGSDDVLKKMNRQYDKKTFIEKALKLKERIPGISLSTDIIVGFPGESEEDFKDTLDVLKIVRFDAAYTFIYSKRNGTPAASFPDQVDIDVTKERFDRLVNLQGEISAENLKKREGSIGLVLFENISEYDTSLVTGKLESGITVHVPGDESIIGQILNVKLNKSHGFYYTGELIR